MKRIAFFLVALFILAANAAFADKVICSDGTTYEGIIVYEDDDAIVMEVPRYPIKLSIYKGSVKQVQRGSEDENSKLRQKISDVKKMRGFIN